MTNQPGVAVPPLSAEIQARIASDFRAGDRAAVERELLRYAASAQPHEPERVQLAILELAKGNARDAAHYAEQAIKDYRDVLYWAFYYDARDRG